MIEAVTALHNPTSRPFKKRCLADTSLPAHRTSFASENQRRLALLAGNQCPSCGEECHFDGRRLLCSSRVGCVYAWSNAESAEDEIYLGIS